MKFIYHDTIHTLHTLELWAVEEFLTFDVAVDFDPVNPSRLTLNLKLRKISRTVDRNFFSRTLYTRALTKLEKHIFKKIAVAFG